MAAKNEYSIHLDKKFGHSTLINIPALVDSCSEKWFNQTLCQVNDCVVRLGVVEGEFHWHKHNHEDEFFYVVDGLLYVDLEDKTVELYPQQGLWVSKGVRHRTRAPKRTAILMIEGSAVKPTGD